MSSIRFESNDDIAKWKKAIENMGRILETAKSERRIVKKFCDSEIETAQFWARYARERTNDLKLRDIAAHDLNRVISNVEMMQGTTIDMYEKVLTYLKNIQIINEKR
jgi:hypothetical protein